MKVYIERKFSAAHHLPGYDGACAENHGHTFKVEIWLEGDVDEKTGMLVDFKLIKNVIDRYDHCKGGLNTILDMPTAENIVKRILKTLVLFHGLESIRVRVWESDNSYAEDEIHIKSPWIRNEGETITEFDDRLVEMSAAEARQKDELVDGTTGYARRFLERRGTAMVDAKMTELEFRRATDGKFEPLQKAQLLDTIDGLIEDASAGRPPAPPVDHRAEWARPVVQPNEEYHMENPDDVSGE